MEETEWEKDETPYLIFRCNKCKRYLYVKTIQKSKKCLQCGHIHKVSTISISGEIVNGMTNAINTVKEKQNELAVKESGNNLEFRGWQDFRVVKKQKDIKFHNNEIDSENELTEKFKRMLIELSKTYKEFPDYVIEVMAEDYNIPNSEIKVLTRYFLKEGFLIQLDNYLYSICINNS